MAARQNLAAYYKHIYAMRYCTRAGSILGGLTRASHVCAGDSRACSLPYSFLSTIPERKERLRGLLFPLRTSPAKTASDCT